MITKEDKGNLKMDDLLSGNAVQVLEGDLERNLQANGRFSKFSQLYAFTSENLTGYMLNLPLEGARVLTIGGSGDQIVIAAMYGADEIVAFDINSLAGLYVDLKLSALNGLSLEEFKKFLLREGEDGQLNPNALDMRVYQMLRGELAEPTRHFFDRAYEITEEDGSTLRESPLFNNRYDTNALKIMSNPFLQTEANYEKAKETMIHQTPRWVEATAQSVVDRVDGTFDVILLSNIADYANLTSTERDNYLNEFVQKVIKPLSRRLNSQGVMCAAYVYDADTTGDRPHYRSQIDNPNTRRSILGSSGLNYREQHFDSVIPGKQDAVVILQKQ